MVTVSRRVAPVSDDLVCVVGRAESIRITSPEAASHPAALPITLHQSRNPGKWSAGGPAGQPMQGCGQGRSRKDLEGKGIDAGRSTADYPLDNSRYNEYYRPASPGGSP